MTNRMQKVLRSICETMLRHPDVGIWTFNNGTYIDVTQWDEQKQIHYSFYEWQEDCIINTQLDNLEQMCWLIANKNARTDDARTDDARTDYVRPETDDEDINYGSKNHN